MTLIGGSLAVTPATLTITANSDIKAYGTLKTFAATAFSQVGLVTANGDSITGVTETSTGAPAAATVGTYSIVPSAAAGNGLVNYSIKYVSGTLTVTTATGSIYVLDPNGLGRPQSLRKRRDQRRRQHRGRLELDERHPGQRQCQGHGRRSPGGGWRQQERECKRHQDRHSRSNRRPARGD